jgi:hypothetical protein
MEKEDGTTLGQELVYKNENIVHIMRDLGIPLWNVNYKMRHHETPTPPSTFPIIRSTSPCGFT